MVVPKLSALDVRRMCLDFDADDVGFDDISRTELDDQRENIIEMETIIV